MSEVKKTAEVYQIDYACDSGCGGFQRPTGVSLLSNPAQYEHQCTVCKIPKRFRTNYPHISYVVTDSAEIGKAKP